MCKELVRFTSLPVVRQRHNQTLSASPNVRKSASIARKPSFKYLQTGVKTIIRIIETEPRIAEEPRANEANKLRWESNEKMKQKSTIDIVLPPGLVKSTADLYRNIDEAAKHGGKQE